MTSIGSTIYRHVRISIKKYLQGDFTESILKALDEIFIDKESMISMIEMVERIKSLETNTANISENRVKDLLFHTTADKQLNCQIKNLEDKVDKLMNDLYDKKNDNNKNIDIIIEDKSIDKEANLETLKKEFGICNQEQNVTISYEENNIINNEEKTTNIQDLVQCEICDKEFDIEKEDMVELSREQTENVDEEFIMCNNCFQHNKDTLKEEGWNGDAYSIEDNEKEEVIKEEKKNEVDIKPPVYFEKTFTKDKNGEWIEKKKEEDKEEVVEEEEEEGEEEEEEEELEVEEFTHKGKRYYLVGSKEDGEVYSIGEDEDLGELQGSYVLFINH